MENMSPSTENVTPPSAATAATRPSTSIRRLTPLGRFTLAGVAGVLIVAVLAIPRVLPAPGANAPRGSAPQRTTHPADVAPMSSISAPVAVVPAAMTETVTVSPDTASPALQEPSKKAAAPKTEKHRIAKSAKSTASIGAASPSDAPDEADSVTTPAAPEPIATTPIPESVTAGTVIPPVTITGCLEISANEDAFRLINAEGVDAPKARSWRTGFLKKRSAPVVLIEPPDPQALQMQVGKRVAATGTLTSRELKVSSLHVVSPSCN
jgi:hypothetical protein